MLETQLCSLGKVIQHRHVPLGPHSTSWTLDCTIGCIVSDGGGGPAGGLQVVTVSERRGVGELGEGLEAVREHYVPGAVPPLGLVDQRLAALVQAYWKMGIIKLK